MLVLSRRVGQQIRIGESIVVTLLRVDRNKARIGVEAPLGVSVFRQELLDFESPRTPMRTSNLATGRDDVNVNRPVQRGVPRPRFLWNEAAV